MKEETRREVLNLIELNNIQNPDDERIETCIADRFPEEYTTETEYIQFQEEIGNMIGTLIGKIKGQLQGDNNGICFLDAQHSDWVEVHIDQDSIKINFDNMQVQAEGTIESMNFWWNEKRKQWISEWGDGHEFTPEKYNHEWDDEEQKRGKIFGVDGQWTFELQIEEDGFEYYVKLEEMEADEK